MDNLKQMWKHFLSNLALYFNSVCSLILNICFQIGWLSKTNMVFKQWCRDESPYLMQAPERIHVNTEKWKPKHNEQNNLILVLDLLFKSIVHKSCVCVCAYVCIANENQALVNAPSTWLLCNHSVNVCWGTCWVFVLNIPCLISINDFDISCTEMGGEYWSKILYWYGLFLCVSVSITVLFP